MPSMRAAPHPVEYDFGSQEDRLVEDFLSEDFEKLWVGTGRANRESFEKIFRPVPNDNIKNWKDYTAWMKPSDGISVSHVRLVVSARNSPGIAMTGMDS
jgi:phospholipase D1/2